MMRVTEYCAKHKIDPKSARARLRRDLGHMQPEGGWVCTKSVLKILDAMRANRKSPTKSKTRVAAKPRKTRVAKPAPAADTTPATPVTDAA